MTHYAVGDVQGQSHCLESLLEKVQFDPVVDRVWFCGDLVNKGPDSVGVLRLVRSLGPNAQTVLGNHDLRLLALAEGWNLEANSSDLQEVLAAPDAAELIQWLYQQPFVLHDSESKKIMTHAGIPPHWTIATAIEQAVKLHNNLNDLEKRRALLDETINPVTVKEQPEDPSIDPLRYALNALTQLRFCLVNGQLDLHHKTPSDALPSGYKAWFDWPRSDDYLKLFGHWSTLRGITGNSRFLALDRGAASRGMLCMVDLDTRVCWTCSSQGTIDAC